MANYSQVSYGSKGEDVLELQRKLNSTNYGYNLAEDGDFGSNTLAAVKDYQKRSGLAEDGIVGTNTWGALNNVQASSTTAQQAEPKFEYKAYKPSDTVAQAEALLQQQLANKPGEYQSAWQSQLNDTLQKILNREKFSYDLNGDMLYQQYKDQYTTQGKMAMMDTMGQAAAMTGGYGNSYAQSVGQQAYQGYLQQLNDKIPELYQLALNQYNAEGDDMYNQASLMAQMEEQDYGRYRDQVSDYNTELGRLTEDSRYQSETDYGRWADDLNFNYGQYRDSVADEQWQAQFDEAKRQYDQSYSLSASKSSGGGGGSGSGDGGGGYDNGGYDDDVVKAAQNFVGASDDGLWGSDSAAKAKAKGYNSLAEVVAAMGGGGDGDEDVFTGTTYKEAAAYLRSKGLPTSGLMDSATWARHKNGNNSAGGEHEASSYQEYLAAYIYGKTKK